ncbi:MAG: hypothetical protein II644_03580 [Paludibacteraceae bacterium]|nr:hypothetical protein [Paludibacteraceae bacterium]
MRKFFTIAAAILFAGSMMAEDYVTLFSTDFGSADWAGVTTICAEANSANETINGITFRSYASPAKPYTVDNANGSLTFCNNNSGNNYFMAIPVQGVYDSVIVVIGTVSNSQRVNYLFKETNEIPTSSVSMSSTAANINTNQSITIRYKMASAGDEALVMLGRQGSGQATVIKTITIYTLSSTPNTEPVGSVSIAGPTEAWVGQKVTLKATTDVKADTIWWTDQYGTVQTSKKGVFEFTPDAEGTYTYTAWAENQYNTQPVSLEHSVVATVKPVLEQVVVTDHTTWDFTKAGTGSIEWKDNTTPAKDVDTVLMANIDGINNDANFNAQALMFAGQYPIRESKYCQGPYLEFVVNAPGLVTVDFSNTGTKDVARYVMINGVVNTTVGSLNTTKVTSEAIHVEPGTVTIQGAFDDGTVQYLRIYKVVYQRTGWPTAVEDNEVEVKAIKRIVNGQLVIEKNGVLYNAQGAIVK